MRDTNPYAFLTPIAMKYFRELAAAEKTAQKPRLTLVSAPSMPLKTRKPKMQKTPAPETTKEHLSAMLKDAMPASAPMFPPGVHRKYAALKPIDHISIAHGALEAVRSLTIPSHGAGVSAAGTYDDLGMLARNHLCDLLEIINDRIGLALEMDDAR